jgi:hypothetical protein
VNSFDLLDFVRRDWAAIADAKAQHWARRKRLHGPAGALLAGEALRRQVVALRPGWPTEKDRSEDLANHVRVTECLRLVLSARAY